MVMRSTKDKAMELIDRFERANHFGRLTQLVVEIPTSQGGNEIISAGHLWKRGDKPPVFFGNTGTIEPSKVVQYAIAPSGQNAE